MHYTDNTFFNPSSRLRELWSLVPQVRTLQVGEHKSRAYHSDVSSAIPLFYILMFMAIGFDIYLGFFILSKQGVNLGLIIGSVIADLFLGFLPFMIEGYFVKDLNHTKVENAILVKELEYGCQKYDESDGEFRARQSRILNQELPSLYRKRRTGKIYRILIALIIFSIAAWKIYTFMSVLPPGFSIWSVVKGKIIIIFSLLTAIFHLIGTEKAVAHFFYSTTKKSNFKRHVKFDTGAQPDPESIEIEYNASFKEARKGNTSIVKDGERFFLRFIHLIKDGEIQALINAQTDPVARKAIAIKCKENQFV